MYGGDGLGHHDGHTVFVPFVLPDETVSIEPLEQKKKFIRGRVAQIVTPSPERIAAPCPHFGVCGGCNYQHMPYESQLQLQGGHSARDAFAAGAHRWDGPIVTHASPPFGYRNRAQWKIAPSADGGRRGASATYEAGSQKLCPVQRVPDSFAALGRDLAALVATAARGQAAGRRCAKSKPLPTTPTTKLLLNLSFERLDGPPSRSPTMLRAELPGVETLLFQDRRADRFRTGRARAYLLSRRRRTTIAWATFRFFR